MIHLQYNRIDLPEKSEYFDKEYAILTYLKSKPYYHVINGLNDDIKVIDDVSEALSPALVYCQVDDSSKRQYLDDYVERNEQTTLILSTLEIQSINKKKKVRLAENPYQKINLLNEILYRDSNIKTALILDFPTHLHEILNF